MKKVLLLSFLTVAMLSCMESKKEVEVSEKDTLILEEEIVMDTLEIVMDTLEMEKDTVMVEDWIKTEKNEE